MFTRLHEIESRKKVLNTFVNLSSLKNLKCCNSWDNSAIIPSLCIPLNVHFLMVWSSLGVVESCLNYAGYESAKIMRSDGTFHGQNELMCYISEEQSLICKRASSLEIFPFIATAWNGTMLHLEKDLVR